MISDLNGSLGSRQFTCIDTLGEFLITDGSWF